MDLVTTEQKERRSATGKRRRAENHAHVLAIESASRKKHRAEKNQWNAEHRDETNAYCRDRHQRLKDDPEYKRKRSEYAAARYIANKERLSAQRRAYRQANPEKVTVENHRRRARRIAADGELSPGIVSFLMRMQRGLCANCREPLAKSGHHLDHIMPLSKGGSNDDGNVQLLCPTCNACKHAKDPIEWAQAQGRLL